MTVIPFKSPKKKPIPIPATACRIFADFGFRLDQEQMLKMHLQRRRIGAEVWFHLGAFQWNVSVSENHYPKTFADAREWAANYCARYGHDAPQEIKKERTPRPKGDSAKQLKSGECREEWLSSDVPALWAEAMMRCQHAGGHCGYDGFCHYGDCDMIMKEKETETMG